MSALITVLIDSSIIDNCTFIILSIYTGYLLLLHQAVKFGKRIGIDPCSINQARFTQEQPTLKSQDLREGRLSNLNHFIECIMNTSRRTIRFL
ncbi:hypothetical protein AUEXF2481DRAFT_7364 [Aureobasidium subglaciale EXF-2481]|uniref:Uncharacterized protein n=1 Tax=Aureobasidium subglaciale (strain EXF-2481) TaxID=1043005 RepID=A0A074YEW5_AURSE|nr:uncharacterized protein AUEXF2481DRAFT_7364 [Aureobasidium subglaciale EXF-2481]KAI5210898.1 hypothetical protein E4T38_01858 [Aureobasidium subglaciale]KAI5229331.1 hypothetical protein E4T40_01621 [Aureobasidium subglaciale]KAI5232883.1 hypothetical protein E4T41_01856 [Aureobasidium subglaciale]KAI5266254.1 hypothetical protein E4T46_01618 [Aureobasidium subglaciale]KEQ92607.1 hypothetical protein AUEXF2481DRAFT_7364 [Aureobasidium subglaciale EXF-2481]